MDARVEIAFIFFAISMSLTPGGGNITLLGISNRFGFNAALPFVAGTSFGVLIIFAGVSAGLFGILTAHPSLYIALKFIGAVYLLYVAWSMLNFQFKNRQKIEQPSGFLTGASLQILNPKAWIAAMTALSQFINVSDDYEMQVVIITVAFLIIMTLCTLVWAYFGVIVGNLLKSPRQMLVVNRCLSSTLVITVIFMVTQ